ncbi:MAG: hypothetical protein HEQ34_06055 [Sphingorhabdus sp.]|jgi:hypothetical protein|uniref:hypothetical protein n=1 Tax=Sphingorhabdus sp. TaxID=1902408 RepID=UPI0025FC5771|nr:hypothetical protein [Sphingorhabdus sp.]MCO4091500.1 hypothetical protein [Sphingorhabdus sp.]
MIGIAHFMAALLSLSMIGVMILEAAAPQNIMAREPDRQKLRKFEAERDAILREAHVRHRMGGSVTKTLNHQSATETR